MNTVFFVASFEMYIVAFGSCSVSYRDQRKQDHPNHKLL